MCVCQRPQKGDVCNQQHVLLLLFVCLFVCFFFGGGGGGGGTLTLMLYMYMHNTTPACVIDVRDVISVHL